jgi:hypothetical protein
MSISPQRRRFLPPADLSAQADLLDSAGHIATHPGGNQVKLSKFYHHI